MQTGRVPFGISLALAALLAAASAHADLYSAQLAYEKKDFEASFKEFKALAELGHPLAQYDLAIMYARGEGAERNSVYAYAWATLAAESGMEGARKFAEQLEPNLSPASLNFAHDIEARFNRAALDKRLMPRMLAGVEYSDRTPCRKEKMAIPEYPGAASMQGIQGQVFVEFTVMPDGRARLPRMIYAVPPKFFESAVRDGVLHSKFTPAMIDGKRVPCTAVFMYRFVTGDSSAQYNGLDTIVKKTLAQAEAGDPHSQALYGFLIAGLPQLNKSYDDALPWLLKAAQAGMPVAQYQVGYSLLHGRGCECEENKAAEWLRKAAEADQPDAQVTLARYALREVDDEASAKRALVWLERAARQNADGKFYLAALLASSPVDDVRDAKRAGELIEEVFKDFDDDPTTFEIRAAARAGVGDFKGALVDQNKALAKARKLEWDVRPQNGRLKQYQAHQPWRGDSLVY
ncbi:MAG: TonB family protein [Steroidobacterales bacterium]